MRSFHVSKRWRNGTSDDRYTNTPISTPKRVMTPNSLPNCTSGTRPMNIMSSTTPKSRPAVERFSVNIKPTMGRVTHMIILNARLSAPFSRWVRANMRATVMMREPLAISEGWNCMKPKFIQRAASLVAAPDNRVIISSSTERGMDSMGSILNIRHGMRCTNSTMMVPAPKKRACLTSGSQKRPDLYDSVLAALYTSTSDMTHRKK